MIGLYVIEEEKARRKGKSFDGIVALQSVNKDAKRFVLICLQPPCKSRSFVIFASMCCLETI